MPHLITTPTFQYQQGELFEEQGAEYPINVIYYDDGCITLEQGGHSVTTNKKWLDGLFREIKKHIPAAEKHLSK